MCLAIPGQILSIHDDELRLGRVSFGGIVKEIVLAYVPEAQVGDYVLAHTGFAISIVSEKHAKEVFSYLERIGESGEVAE